MAKAAHQRPVPGRWLRAAYEPQCQPRANSGSGEDGDTETGVSDESFAIGARSDRWLNWGTNLTGASDWL